MKKLAVVSCLIGAVALIAVVSASAATTITVKMTGKAESPKGDPDGKGTAKITLTPSKGKVCFRLTWSGIGNPTAAHIHKGGKGVAGPVVIPFFATPPKHTGCVTAKKSLVAAIAKHPAQYYVNVHNKKYPAGALRAQL
jgi:hypothetical protein